MNKKPLSKNLNLSPMKNDILVSVCILTWNRKDLILSNLHELQKQTYKNTEIIVVDNGSRDGTSDEIKRKFNNVNLIVVEKNIGISGRNKAIHAAQGSVIVTLDDDVFFRRDDEIERIVNFFEKNINTDVVVMKILDIKGQMLALNWFHPYDIYKYEDSSFETDYIAEGATIFRRLVFEKVGLYPESFFITHEGPDLALRLLNEGFTINYSPEIQVIHKCDPAGKTIARMIYYNIRNEIFLSVRNYPFPKCISYIIYRILSVLLYSLKQGSIKWYILGLWDGFFNLRKEIPNRKPVTFSTLARIRRIRKNRDSIIKKMILQTLRVKKQKQIYKQLFDNKG